MTQAPSSFVMVPREVMERIEFASNGYCPACDGWMVDKWRGATPGKHAPKCELAKALTVIPVGVDQKRACIEGAVTAESASAELAYWKSVAKQLSDVLLTVRPLGGSELFKRFKDETYLADPEYFKTEISKLRQDALDAKCAAIHASKNSAGARP